MSIAIIVDGVETGRLEIVREGNYTLFSGHCADPGRLLRLSVYGGGEEGYIGVMMPDNGGLSVRKRFSRWDLRSFPASIEYAGEAMQQRERAEARSSRDGAAETPSVSPAEETVIPGAEETPASPEPEKDSPAGACAPFGKKGETSGGEKAPGTGRDAPPSPVPERGDARGTAIRPVCPRFEAKGEPTETDALCAGEDTPCEEEETEEDAGTEGAAEPPSPAARSPDEGTLLWYEVGDGSLYTLWQGRPYVAIPLSAHGLPEERIVERRSIEGVDYAVFAAESWE